MACGRVDAFLHAGEQPWDYAAGALILEEAGGRIASLQHDDYWRPDHPQEWSKSVIAARHPALFDEWKRWVLATCDSAKKYVERHLASFSSHFCSETRANASVWSFHANKIPVTPQLPPAQVVRA